MTFSNNEEKVLYVLESIHSGRDIDQIARDLGYKNYKSLDMFMRREGYVKEKRLGNYLPKSGKGIVYGDIKAKNAHVSTKALEVMQLFKREDLSPKRVAEEAGFESPKEMAAYMKSKGFIWDSDRSNYVMEGDEDLDLSPPVVMTPTSPQNESQTKTPAPEAKMPQEFMALLQYLDSRKETLVDLLEKSAQGDSGQLPRYVLPGVFITKSVHMSNHLDQMIRDFSDEMNITQKEIFEIAMIDFLKKYGYHKEVNVMLGHLG